MPPNHRIVPLYVGSLVDMDRCVFKPDLPAGGLYDAPCIAWVVDDGDRAFLVDAGPGSPERAAGHHPPLRQALDENLTGALHRAGYRLEDLEFMVLSHLHWDHIGGLPEVPDVPIFVQERELRFAVHPIESHRGPYEVGTAGLRPVWTDALDRMEVVDGERELRPGVRIIPLPGHTPGSHGALVSTRAGDHLITGDALPLFDNWSDDPAQRVPNGVYTDIEEYEQTFELMDRLDAVLLPGHDPAVFDVESYPTADRMED
jgi:N-acyl homoserine lactone hydrolase